MRAYVLIESSSERARSLQRAIQRLKGVRNADLVVGPCDIIAVVEGPNIRAIKSLVASKVEPLKGVFKTSISFEKTAAAASLSRQLRSDRDHLRIKAAMEIGHLRVHSAVPSLEKALRDKNPAVQISAALALWRIHKSTTGVPALVKALLSENRDASLASMFVLKSMGKQSIDWLVSALSRKKGREKVVRLLGEIGGKEAIGALRNADLYRDEMTAAEAHRALERAGRTKLERESVPPAPGVLPNSLTVITHGSLPDKWWRWGESFPLYIDDLTHDVYKGGDPFEWNGGFDEEDLEEGARALVAWLRANRMDRVTIIAHSNGGNVAIIASNQLEPDRRIDKLILLGTPLVEQYIPNAARIGVLYNVYSEEDWVQPLGEWYLGGARGDGRTLPEARENIKVGVVNLQEAHSDLHNPEVWRRNGLDRLLT